MQVSVATARAVCGVLALAVASAALAQVSAAGSVALRLATVVEKVVVTQSPDGTTTQQLLPAAAVVPGDEVVYTVTFKNAGSRTADNVRITNPIPSNMQYVADTAFGPGSEVLYSIDGGATFWRPSELFVTTSDGVRRQAVASDYTHIRWVLKAPLAAGAEGFARFRATVR